MGTTWVLGVLYVALLIANAILAVIIMQRGNEIKKLKRERDRLRKRAKRQLEDMLATPYSE